MRQKLLINLKYAVRPRKSLLTLRLIWNYIQIIVFRRQLLRYVDMAIGYLCNRNCEHCFAKDLRDPKRGRMPPRHFAKVAEECMKLGAVNFSFQGGEPLLYEDLKDYVKAARPYKNLISVTTNGELLTGEKIKELKSWGVDIVTMSIDSHREPVTHDFLKLGWIRSAGMNVTVGTVVTHEDVRKLRMWEHPFLQILMRRARQDKFILMLIFAVPTGGWEGRDDVMLTPDDVKYVRELCKKNPYVRTDFQANYIHEGCGAAKEILYINPYGDVYACPFINIPFGNVRYKTIKRIRESMLCNKMFQNYGPRCIAGEGKGIREYL